MPAHSRVAEKSRAPKMSSPVAADAKAKAASAKRRRDLSEPTTLMIDDLTKELGVPAKWFTYYSIVPGQLTLYGREEYRDKILAAERLGHLEYMREAAAVRTVVRFAPPTPVILHRTAV